MVDASPFTHCGGRGFASCTEEPSDRPAIYAGGERSSEKSSVASTSLCFGIICLVRWDDSLELKDLLNLRRDVQRLRQIRAGAPIILIVSISDSVGFPPSPVANAVTQSLPGILSHCSDLLVAIAGEDSHRRLFRALFSGGQRSGAVRTVEFHDSLDAALISARRLAPQDALQLQRLARMQRRGEP